MFTIQTYYNSFTDEILFRLHQFLIQFGKHDLKVNIALNQIIFYSNLFSLIKLFENVNRHPFKRNMSIFFFSDILQFNVRTSPLTL